MDYYNSVGVGTDLWIIITVCVGVGTGLWIIITVCGCRHRPVDYYNL